MQRGASRVISFLHLRYSGFERMRSAVLLASSLPRPHRGRHNPRRSTSKQSPSTWPLTNCLRLQTSSHVPSGQNSSSGPLFLTATVSGKLLESCFISSDRKDCQATAQPMTAASSSRRRRRTPRSVDYSRLVTDPDLGHRVGD